MPSNDDESRIAYIFCKASDVEVIGKAVLTIGDDE